MSIIIEEDKDKDKDKAGKAEAGDKEAVEDNTEAGSMVVADMD
jgi:hypothetical protein